MNWTRLLPDDWGSFFYGVASTWVVIVVGSAIIIFLVYLSATGSHQEQGDDVQPEVLD